MSAIPMVEAVDELINPVNDRSALGLTELLLKNNRRVDALVREEAWQPDLIPRFLGVAVTSFSVFSLALAIILSLVPADYLPNLLKEAWQRSPTRAGVSLGLAYVLGLVAATGVCLPSFYFYALLAGVKISMLQVVAHVLKGKAAGAIMLMGVLPIYVAVAL